MNRNPGGWLWACLVAALVSGCGSTVRQTTTLGVAAPDTTRSTATATATTGTADAQSTSGPAGGAATSGSGRPSSGTAASVGGNGGADSAASADSGDLAIGVFYDAGVDELAQSVGASTGAFGDFQSYYSLAIDAANAAGGIAGRRIVPVFRARDINGDVSAQEQAACEDFTRDHPVFAVLATSRQTDNFRGCLEERGVLGFAQGGVTPADAHTYEEFPHYAEAGALNLSRVASLSSSRLAQRGFFDGGSIGLVTWDLPTFRRAVDEQVIPSLSASGFHLTETFYAPYFSSVGDLGAASAAVQSAVLRFAQRGINRVLLLGDGVGLAVLFMTQAEAQLYRPRYGLNTSEGAGGLPGTVPASQLQGAIGIGWSPAADLAAPDDPITADRQRCLDIMRDGGQPMDSRNAQVSAYVVCDHVQAFVAAATAASTPLSIDSFVAALDDIGDLPTLSVLAVRYGDGRRDGVAGYRDLDFTGSCGCFRYTSSLLAA